MKSRLTIGVLAAAALAAGLALPLQAADTAAPVIHSARVSGVKNLADPTGGFWSQAKAVAVAMQPQNAATPMNLNPAIAQLSVRSVHDDKNMAVLVEWKDTTASQQAVVDKFGDQVAIEMPLAYQKDNLPSPMMGNPGGRVAIWQWRAVLQQDVDKGEPDIKKLYPNLKYDLYPDQILPKETAALYSGATGLGNPVSRGDGSPVLEQMAEGFGTLTDTPDKPLVNGRGVWKDNMWRVAFVYPLKAGSKYGPDLAAGGESATAFAVWDGGNKEVGSRKAWSDWVTLKLAN